MLKIDLSRSKTGGKCTWESGGFNGEDYGYSRIVADKFGNAKISMMKNTKPDLICGEHLLFAMKEGEFIIADDFLDGFHHIQVLQITRILDVCDKSFGLLKLCWEYKNKQWSEPASEIFDLRGKLAEVIAIAMDKAMCEGCSEGFYFKEKQGV